MKMFKNVFSFETFIIHLLAWTYKPWIGNSPISVKR